MARTRLTRRAFGTPLRQLGTPLLGSTLFFLVGANIFGTHRWCGIQSTGLRCLLDPCLLARRKIGSLAGALRLLLFGARLTLGRFLTAAVEIVLRALAVLGQTRIIFLGLLQCVLPALFMFGILRATQIAVGFHFDALDLCLGRPQFTIDVLDASGDEETTLALHLFVVGRPFRARVGVGHFRKRGLRLCLGSNGSGRKMAAQSNRWGCNRRVLGMDLHANSEE